MPQIRKGEPLRHKGKNGKPTMIIDPAYFQLNEGDDALFTCKVLEGKPITSIHWTKGKDGHLPSNAMTDEFGHIRIDSVTPEDASEYCCHVANSLGTTTASVGVYIQKPKGYGTPKVRIKPTHLALEEGETAKFKCKLVRDVYKSNTTMRWTKGMDGALPSHVFTDGSRLRIDSVEPGDQSEYFCHVTNGVDTTVAKASLFVREGGQSAMKRQIEASPSSNIDTKEGGVLSDWYMSKKESVGDGNRLEKTASDTVIGNDDESNILGSEVSTHSNSVDKDEHTIHTVIENDLPETGTQTEESDEKHSTANSRCKKSSITLIQKSMAVLEYTRDFREGYLSRREIERKQSRGQAATETT